MILFRYIFLLNINFFIIIFRFIDDKESVSNCSSCFTLMSWLDLFISHHLFRKHGQMTKLCSDYYFSWANTWILFNIFIWNMKVFVEYMWSYQRFYQGFFFFFFCNQLLRKLISLSSVCIWDFKEHMISGVLDVLHFDILHFFIS